MKQMTPKQMAVMDLAHAALHFGNRGSIDAQFVAARLGWTIRQASGTLSSLDRRGTLRAIPNGFVQKTFYVFPDGPPQD